MNINFNEPPGDSGVQLQGNFSMARQTSIFSLTFDELQSTVGGPAKDFGSMNMDELLKSIWSAEETQTQNAGSTSGVQEGAIPSGYLQRQGSLTLPRTLSQKTVDEVWRGLSKDYGGGFKDSGLPESSKMHHTQRQPTLGEITLEEFLVKAGVVMEDTQPVDEKSNNDGLFSNFLQSGNNRSSGIGFQQNEESLGLMGNSIAGTTNQISFQSPNSQMKVSGGRSGQQQLPTLQPRPQKQRQQQQQLFPKQTTSPYATPIIPLETNGHLCSRGIRAGMMGMSDTGTNGNLVQTATQEGGLGMVALGAGAATVAMGSPALSSDGIGKSNGDMSSVSPIPYLFNGGLRGRKSSAVEKVVERRQRRMIKNRESAARSRARKQAYTMKLEAEISKLQEENEELRKKQEKLQMQKNQQVSEVMEYQQRAKRWCLRRTQTGPW